jgi:hypothetical protein
VVAACAVGVLGPASHLNSGLGAAGPRAWRSHLSVIALLRMLHVFTLDVLVFNLVILKSLLHELVQLVQALIPLLVVALGPLLHLVVVHHVIVRARVTFVHLEAVLGLLLLVATAGQIVLTCVLRMVVLVLPSVVANLLLLRKLLQLILVLLQVLVLLLGGLGRSADVWVGRLLPTVVERVLLCWL